MNIQLITQSQLFGNKQIHKIKLSVLGKGMVGKSSLTYRFINYNTPLEHDATIEDKYKTIVDIDQNNCEIEILDTAGQEDYQGMLETWINFGEGFLLVYAVNDRESFECLEKKREKILKLKKASNFPIVLVGNKCDLERERKVEEADARELARKWGAGYIETSATIPINCKESFVMLAKQILKPKLGLPTEVETRSSTNNKKRCIFC